MATKPFLSQIAVPVGTTTGDVYYPQTSLLMHFNGTNGSTTMTDNSKNNFPATSYNGAAISTAQSKFGGASGFFDGTNDYVLIPANNAFTLGGDFTVECWFYCTAANFSSGLIGLFGRNTYGFNNGGFPRIEFNSAGKPSLTYAANTTIVGTTTVTVNTWHHIAVVRYSGIIVFYLNGVSQGTATYSTSIPATYDILIGNAPWSSVYPNLYFQGFIDEFRVTNGYARYTGAFTPPTEQFLDSAGDANSNVVVNSTATGFAIGTGGINGAQLAKAWVNFNGTGTVAIRDSYNVSSITDNGTGDYTINYGTALNNSNYAISGITDYNESGLHRVIVYRSGLSHQYNTLGVRIHIIGQVGSSDSTQDPVFASLMVLGN